MKIYRKYRYIINLGRLKIFRDNTIVQPLKKLFRNYWLKIEYERLSGLPYTPEILNYLIEYGFNVIFDICNDKDSKDIERYIKNNPCLDLYFYEFIKERLGRVPSYLITYVETQYGDYVGDVERAVWLARNGIKPEKINDDTKICSIGKDKKGKWYGWNHRGYGVFETREEAIKWIKLYD